MAGARRRARLLIDPPYTASGKRADRRLYAHHEIDHVRLFRALADEISSLVARHGLHTTTVVMKNSHHANLSEMIITCKALCT